MQKRDTIILIVAIVCGLLAFSMVVNVMRSGKRPAAEKKALTSLPIPEGMIALTLSPGEIENIPDLLKVGSHVDVLGIAPNYKGENELQTIVRSAQVLSIDKDAKAQIRALSIALTSGGAEVVSKASDEEKLRLVLRPDSGEKGVFQFKGVGFTEIIRGVKKEKSMRTGQ